MLARCWSCSVACAAYEIQKTLTMFWSRFMFATGIECSCPLFTDSDGRKRRMDQLESTFHYRHWREDLNLVRDLGIKFLRYGPPYYRTHLGPNRYDWEFTDLVFGEMRRLGIVPIVDLCHFGVPDWIGDFQNSDWPEHFAAYARAFAERFPWVNLFTPVNEIFVCAKLSTLAGFWNEQKHDERSFVTALRHLCRANLLAIREISAVREAPVFIQSESSEHFHPGAAEEKTRERVRWENERRFLSLDLLYSQSPSAEAVLFLLDHGMPRTEFEWFMKHGLGEKIIVGLDFYERNEQVVMADGTMHSAGDVLGWSGVAREYYARYRRPMMHTETNTGDEKQAPRWLWKEFFNVLHAREAGVPVMGFTWYSLVDQVDWNSAFSNPMGLINPLGLFDLQRRARPVAHAYRELIRHFDREPLLPTSSALGIRVLEDAL
jgi:beta-glucosidase/6-phospho-beta-glucosidase/beta-galactosidase